MIDNVIDLQELIAMSRTMLGKAQEDAWDEVFSMEEKRREWIRTYFLEPIQQAATQIVAEGIQEIIAIDSEIMALGAQKKLELGLELQKMDQGKKAVKAYTS